MGEKVIAALTELLRLILTTFGPWGTVGLAILIYVGFLGLKYYNDRRKDTEVHLALAEKEKAVQRVSNDLRLYKILELKEKHGFTDDQVDRFLIMTDFQDPEEAVKFLERPYEERKGIKDDDS